MISNKNTVKENLDYSIFDTQEIDFGKIVPKYIRTENIKDSIILIKLDLFSGLKSVQSGTTTNPVLLDKLLSVLSTYDPKKVYLAESGNKLPASTLFGQMGYIEIATKYPCVELLDLDKAPLIDLVGNKDTKFRDVEISEKLLEVDYFISFTNLKSSTTERVSGCLLNQFNFLSNSEQKTHWLAFSSRLSFDLYTLFKPTFCVLDSTLVLRNMGPVEGSPMLVNKVIVGANPICVDAVGCRLLNMSYFEVPSLRVAAKKAKLVDDIDLILSKIKPLDKSFDNVMGTNFFVIRFALLMSQFTEYLKNLSFLVFLGGLALVSIGGKDLMTGKWMSFNNYFRIAKEVIFKISKPNNLLNWKIAINKHVREKTLS